mmetsp:Transcript_27155/g.90249  ORF Transcript_27155/g.90249 Transcript_27155/m.90249 type:complete len:207 (+) Transcript_27155:97-717(+)
MGCPDERLVRRYWSSSRVLEQCPCGQGLWHRHARAPLRAPAASIRNLHARRFLMPTAHGTGTGSGCAEAARCAEGQRRPGFFVVIVPRLSRPASAARCLGRQARHQGAHMHRGLDRTEGRWRRSRRWERWRAVYERVGPLAYAPRDAGAVPGEVEGPGTKKGRYRPGLSCVPLPAHAAHAGVRASTTALGLGWCCPHRQRLCLPRR